MVESVAKEIGTFCVGAAAIGLGDPSGGMVTAGAATALGAMGLGRWLTGQRDVSAVVTAVINEHSKQRGKRGDNHTDLDAVEALMSKCMPDCFLHKQELAGAAFAGDRFPMGAATLIVARLGITKPQGFTDQAISHAHRLIVVGITAAMQHAEFLKAFMLELTLEQAHQTGITRRGVDAANEKLDRIEARLDGILPPYLLKYLAGQFGNTNPGAPEDELVAFLESQAQVFKDMETRLDAFTATDSRLANLIGSAKAALQTGQFDEADERLRDAEDIALVEKTLGPVRQQAGLRAERGTARLLAGDTDRAAALFVQSAEMLAPFAQDEAWALLHDRASELYARGLRFGGNGLANAIALWRSALLLAPKTEQPIPWAATQNNLGVALSNQGSRSGGAAGVALLGQAVTTFRDALSVYTQAEHPVDWAITQNNLGNALDDQGSRSGGAAGVALLGQAVSAFEAALTVFTQGEHPVDWANTNGNLAIVFLSKSELEPNTAKASLTTALTHVDAALTVFDPTHMPHDHQRATALGFKFEVRRLI